MWPGLRRLEGSVFRALGPKCIRGAQAARRGQGGAEGLPRAGEGALSAAFTSLSSSRTFQQLSVCIFPHL